MDRYSERAFEVLAADLPAFAREFREQPEGSLFLESESPSGYRFWISTEGNRVTVGFDAHHAHFGESCQEEAAEDARDAVEYIRKLMNGEYRVAVWSRGEKLVKSETMDLGVDPRQVARPWLCRWLLRGCSVEVRGW